MPRVASFPRIRVSEPAAGLQSSDPHRHGFGERLMYLPLAGLLGAVMALWCHWWMRPAGKLQPVSVRRASHPLALVGVVVAALGYRTFQRNKDWLTEETLWTMRRANLSGKLQGLQGIGRGDRRSRSSGRQNRRDHRLGPTGRRDSQAKSAAGRGRAHALLCDLAVYYTHKGDRIARQYGSGSSIPAEAMVYYRKVLEPLDRAVQCDHAVNQASRQRRLSLGFAANDIPDVGMYQIYELLAKVQARLGHTAAAMEACRYACHRNHPCSVVPASGKDQSVRDRKRRTRPSPTSKRCSWARPIRDWKSSSRAFTRVCSSTMRSFSNGRPAVNYEKLAGPRASQAGLPGPDRAILGGQATEGGPHAAGPGCPVVRLSQGILRRSLERGPLTPRAGTIVTFIRGCANAARRSIASRGPAGIRSYCGIEARKERRPSSAPVG